MALTVGGKRVVIPGGRAPATPLSPLERLLVEGILIVNREIVDAINADEFAEAIRDLDPDLFDRLLNEVLRWQDIQEVLEAALRGVVMDGSLGAARELIRKTPRVQHNPMSALEYLGEVLPNGIIVPSAIGAPPDIQFSITTPVEQMFNYVDGSAVNYARTRAGQLVRAINESNRLAIRQLIVESFIEPRTVDQTAEMIRQIIGLHPRWARAVRNFHDTNYRRMLDDGLSVGQAQNRANELAAKYRDKLIRRRAEMIARTEVQQAQNFGREMGWVASDRAGLIDPRTQKEWRTAPLGSRYGAPCPICTALRGTRVPWNGTFDNGMHMPPAHPNCRCTAVLVPPPRGLTGLPSQRSTASWIPELERLEAEQIEEFKARQAEEMTKHQRGKHDQKTHGAWAKGGGITLEGGQEYLSITDKYIEENLDITYDPRTPLAAQLKRKVVERISERMSDIPSTEIAKAFPSNDPEVFDVRFATGEFESFYEYQKERALAGFPILEPQVGGLPDRVSLTKSGKLFFINSESPDYYLAAPLGSPLAEEYARKALVSNLVQSWATTSNGQSSVSLALQESAAAEFDLKDYSPWTMNADLRSRTDAILERGQPVMQRFVREQYNETQSAFKAMGVSEVVLWRGKSVYSDSPLGQVADEAASTGSAIEIPVQTRPMSSWSTGPFVAESFTGRGRNEEGRTSVMMKMTVPVTSIMSTAVSGVGSYSEQEFVTIGAEFDAQVVGVSRAPLNVNDLFKAAHGPINIDDDDESADWIKSFDSVVKHQRGKHDQSSHGAWAKGSRADAIRDAARTGQPTGITKDDLAAITADPAAFGFAASEFTRRQQRRNMMMEDDEAAVRGMIKSLEDGLRIREERKVAQQAVADSLSPEDQDTLVDYFETIRSQGTVFVAADPVSAAQIVNKGEFDSVFETNKSNGSVAYDARRREEFASHDLHPSLDPNLRPIYGYVAFNNPVTIGASQYGDVRFELKPEVKTRATMTDGDSLGSRATPVPMSGERITREQAVAGSMGWFGYADQGGRTPIDEADTIETVDTSMGGYVEAQVKGGVKLDDVVRIHVDGPPSSSPASYSRSDPDYTFDIEQLEIAAAEKGIEIIFHGADL